MWSEGRETHPTLHLRREPDARLSRFVWLIASGISILDGMVSDFNLTRAIKLLSIK